MVLLCLKRAHGVNVRFEKVCMLLPQKAKGCTFKFMCFSEAGGGLSAVGHNNKQSKAPSVGLVRIHSCLSPPQRLRRNSRGLPSATATYTALKKAAAGGSLIPGHCQSVDAHSQQHASQSIQHQGIPVQNLRKPIPAATCPLPVSRQAERLPAI